MLNQRTRNDESMLRVGGALAAALSLFLGLLVLFVIPMKYAAVSGFELLLFGFMFIVGVGVFLVGSVLRFRRYRR